jgi:hypothetical protein
MVVNSVDSSPSARKEGGIKYYIAFLTEQYSNVRENVLPLHLQFRISYPTDAGSKVMATSNLSHQN